MARITKIKETAPSPLDQYFGVVQIDKEGSDELDGIVVDFRMLKMALIHLQKQNPNLLSVRIGKIKNYKDIPFLAISTKMQEDAGTKELYAMSPLTVHVDQADKFQDIDNAVFLKDTVATSSGGSPKDEEWYIEPKPDYNPVKQPVEKPGPDIEPVKKRGRPKKHG